MRRVNALKAIELAVAGMLTAVAAPIPTASAADLVPVEWQHREIRFSYVGFTTAYVCDALEGQVRRVLMYLGARTDAKVSATCPQGPDVPSGQSSVTADFQVPVPLESAGAAATVQARVVVDPPGFAASGLHGQGRLRTGAGDARAADQELRGPRSEIRRELFSTRSSAAAISS